MGLGWGSPLAVSSASSLQFAFQAFKGTGPVVVPPRDCPYYSALALTTCLFHLLIKMLVFTAAHCDFLVFISGGVTKAGSRINFLLPLIFPASSKVHKWK